MIAWLMIVEFCTLLNYYKIQALMTMSLQVSKNAFSPYREEQIAKFDPKVAGWKHTQQMYMQ